MEPQAASTGCSAAVVSQTGNKIMTIGTVVRMIMGIAGWVVLKAVIQAGAEEAIKYGQKYQDKNKNEKRNIR